MDSPYKGLAAFEERDGPLFYGRDRESRVVLDHVYASRLTVLSGPSGVGKTSLLEAGVTYRVHQTPGRTAVVFRDWQGDVVGNLKRAIGAEVARVAGIPAADPDDSALATYASRFAPVLDVPLVLLLDQFEEYFVFHPATQRVDLLTMDSRTFPVALMHLLAQPECPIHVLIAIREDALSMLQRLAGSMAAVLRSYIQLQHLKPAAAIDAVEGPLEAYNRFRPGAEPVYLESGLAEDVVKRLQSESVDADLAAPEATSQPGGGVDDVQIDISVQAPYLQLVMQRLWEEEVGRGSNTLSRASLRRMGSVSQIVGDHIDRSLARLNRSDREIVARIFQYLVTPSGSMQALGVGTLAFYTELPDNRIASVVERLCRPEMRMLRPLAAPGIDGGDRDARYEVFYRALVPGILDWRWRHVGEQQLTRGRWKAVGVALLAMVASELTPGFPGVLLTLVRSTGLLLVHAVLLQQVYAWFYRFVVVLPGGHTLSAHRISFVGGVLGAVLGLLWLSVTQWPAGCRSIGDLTSAGYAWNYLTLMPTMLVGSVAFLIMRAAGRFAIRVAHVRFSWGFLAGCTAIIGVSVVLIACALLGWWPSGANIAILQPSVVADCAALAAPE